MRTSVSGYRNIAVMLLVFFALECDVVAEAGCVAGLLESLSGSESSMGKRKSLLEGAEELARQYPLDRYTKALVGQRGDQLPSEGFTFSAGIPEDKQNWFRHVTETIDKTLGTHRPRRLIINNSKDRVGVANTDRTGGKYYLMWLGLGGNGKADTFDSATIAHEYGHVAFRQLMMDDFPLYAASHRLGQVGDAISILAGSASKDIAESGKKALRDFEAAAVGKGLSPSLGDALAFEEIYGDILAAVHTRNGKAMIEVGIREGVPEKFLASRDLTVDHPFVSPPSNATAHWHQYEELAPVRSYIWKEGYLNRFSGNPAKLIEKVGKALGKELEEQLYRQLDPSPEARVKRIIGRLRLEFETP